MSKYLEYNPSSEDQEVATKGKTTPQEEMSVTWDRATANWLKQYSDDIRQKCAEKAIKYVTENGTYPSEPWEELRAVIITDLEQEVHNV